MTLLVGDPHIRINALKEAEEFLDRLLVTIKSGKYEQVIILGDLFDTFAVIRTEVMSLWARFLSEVGAYAKVKVLVGNHDMAGENGGAHSLEPFKYFNNVQVIDEPYFEGSHAYFPFYRDNRAFEEACKALPAGTILFAHQSFNGAQFDNGFYDPHGADPACVAHLYGVISGHIHRQQKIANIWYPGTAYQMSFSDAGETKGLFEINLEKDSYNLLNCLDMSMPKYFIVQTESTDHLTGKVKEILALDVDLSRTNFKLIATGGPGEISGFWKDDSVKLLKSKAKRVVDALVSVKAEVVIPGSTAKTKREKLYDFIRSRKWRTDHDKLIASAESSIVGQ